ncbi:hypothetical protein F2Q68_00001523 [Brassica cretica]|uniref:Uncharacterized protein n=1 Tax=Brassica cretica TaxID=69181 RepID=A0A8S9JF07_BRACR|nr:hypothetical protein F2Q68_00001523 [Brassica cretica]
MAESQAKSPGGGESGGDQSPRATQRDQQKVGMQMQRKVANQAKMASSRSLLTKDLSRKVLITAALK